MSNRVFYSSVMAVLFLLAPPLFIACGDGDGRLSRPEVEEIVREELADAPAPTRPEPGLTSADVEEAIRATMADMPQPVSGLSQEEVERVVEDAIASTLASQPGLTSADVEGAIGKAMADMPQPEPGLTSDEAERIARGVVASIPPKSAPAEYTGFFVENAISRYRDPGARHHPRLLQPGGEHRRPMVRLRHRRERPGHRTSRCSPPGAGPEGLGGHRRQRLQLRA